MKGQGHIPAPFSCAAVAENHHAAVDGKAASNLFIFSDSSTINQSFDHMEHRWAQRAKPSMSFEPNLCPAGLRSAPSISIRLGELRKPTCQPTGGATGIDRQLQATLYPQLPLNIHRRPFKTARSALQAPWQHQVESNLRRAFHGTLNAILRSTFLA